MSIKMSHSLKESMGTNMATAYGGRMMKNKNYITLEGMLHHVPKYFVTSYALCNLLTLYS